MSEELIDLLDVAAIAEVQLLLKSTHKASLSEHDFTFAVNTGFQTVVPAGNYSDAVSNHTDFTPDAAAGAQTVNFNGTVELAAPGSFESTANSIIAEGHFFVNEVDTGKGFKRSITQVAAEGSFDSVAKNVAVVSGDILTFRIKVDSGTSTLTFSDLSFDVQRAS